MLVCLFNLYVDAQQVNIFRYILNANKLRGAINKASANTDTEEADIKEMERIWDALDG